MFLTDAASFLLVIGVLAWLSGRMRHGALCERADDWATRRFRWLLELPRGIQVAAVMALLIGGFGIQFEVTPARHRLRRHERRSVGGTGNRAAVCQAGAWRSLSPRHAKSRASPHQAAIAPVLLHGVRAALRE